MADLIPQAIGPYSTHQKAGAFVFTSGQLGLNPETGELVDESTEEQTHQALKNLENVLAQQGIQLNHIVKTTIYLADMGDFKAINEIYATYFEEPYPARTAVQVAALPKGARIEIEAVGFKE